MKGQTLETSFYHDFRNWVKFNMESLTWQGRYRNEFEDFWTSFFTEGLTVKELIERFNYSCKVVKVGPLVSWFNWLKNKFLCFTFIRQGYSIKELADLAELPIDEMSFVLREFFVEKYPHLEDYFNEKLQISNVVNPNINLTIEKIKSDVELDDLSMGSVEDELQPSLEVTLYEEWINLLDKIKTEFKGTKTDVKKISFRDSVIRALKVFRDVVLLLVAAALLIWLIQNANKYYENYLLDRISVYEPQLKWLNKNLIFKKEADVEELGSKVEYDIDEAKPKELTKEEEAQIQEEVFQTESEVMVTSWDSLPRDINEASFEQSDYEEKLRTGYRDYRFGRNKVYRVLLKTSDFIESRKRLIDLSNKYQAEQVDNVKPGKLVPGGAYYNIYIPRKYLKEFLAQVMEHDQGVLYESKTRTRRNPAGKNKVFIWVKSI